MRYLPQLLLAATLTPATLVVVWWHDWVAGVIILGIVVVFSAAWIVGQITGGGVA